MRSVASVVGEKRDRRDRIGTLIVAVSLVALWEISSRRGWINSFVFPAPSQIVMDFPYMWKRGLAQSVAITLTRFFGGLVLGGTLGILLGVVIGWFPRVRRIVDPFIAAFHPIPKLIIFPLFIVIFGVSEMSKIAAIALTVFFPCLISASSGVRQISSLYFQVVQSYGGGRLAVLRHVVLPGSLPTIVSGLRIAANLGLLVTTAIEFAVAAPGIGALIWVSWQTLRIADLFVGVVTLSTIGMSMNALLQWLLRRLAPWQERT
jgi:ABC-type nitrate/sulfonate/bicarbonate transport system permease component